MLTVSPKLIGSNIAKYRKLCGMTQAQLAHQIDVSVPFISRMERGEKLMKLQTLYSVAQALNVSCDALLREESADVHVENIKILLKDQPDRYLPGIERIIRACVEEFEPKEKAQADAGEPEPPVGGTPHDSPTG